MKCYSFQSQNSSGIAIDWSDDSSFIRANSLEASVTFCKVFILICCTNFINQLTCFTGNATTCRPVTNHATMRDTNWVTQNCLVSFDTIGIWPETIDGTDLTIGCKSSTNAFFATGDDFGKLKLYNYPVNKPKVYLNNYL